MTNPHVIACLLYLAGMVPTLGFFLMGVTTGYCRKGPKSNLVLTAVIWPVFAVWLTTAVIKTWKEVYNE